MFGTWLLRTTHENVIYSRYDYSCINELQHLAQDFKRWKIRNKDHSLWAYQEFVWLVFVCFGHNKIIVNHGCHVLLVSGALGNDVVNDFVQLFVRFQG